MAEVKHQLGTLIRHATRDGRLVILIDDLDRCESARALEVCRVASQLLAHDGVVSILLADMSRIAESAAIRFAGGNGPDGTGQSDDAGRRYLEKIAQIELALPPPDPTAMRNVTSGFSASLHAQRASPGVFERGDLDRFADRAAAARRRLEAAFRWTRRSLGEWVEAAKWWPVLAWIPLAVVLIGVVPADPDGYVPGWATAILFVTLFGALGVGIWSSVLRRRRRRRRKDYERRIEELKDQGEVSPEAVEAVVIADAGASALRGERALVGDLVSSSFLDSPEFRTVERFIVDHPPPLPREGKRMFNHAQLLTEIARARGMFGGDPPLEPGHLAKWVVLRERWHAVGRAVLLDPDLMNRLEAAAVGDGSELRFESLGLRVPDEELTQLLRTPPLLGGLIERLIYFMPSRGITEPATTAQHGSREPA